MDKQDERENRRTNGRMPNRANEPSLSWLKPAQSRADVALEPSAFPNQGTSSAPLFLAQLT